MDLGKNLGPNVILLPSPIAGISQDENLEHIFRLRHRMELVLC